MMKNILIPPPKKKTDKLNTQIIQVIKNAEKIKSDKLLLKHINPHLLTSLNYHIKHLSFEIDQRHHSQLVETPKMNTINNHLF